MFQSPGAIAVHVGPIAIRWYGVLLAAAPAPAAVPRRGRAQPSAWAGDRPMGELLQRGSVRRAHRSALEAVYLADAPAAAVRQGRVLPSHVPLRVRVGPRGVRPARLRAPRPSLAGPGRAVPGLRRSLLARPALHRRSTNRPADAGLPPSRAAREPALHGPGPGGGAAAAAPPLRLIGSFPPAA